MSAGSAAILAWIQDHPGAGPRDIEGVFPSLSRTTLNRWLRDLADQGSVVSVRRGPITQHYASDLKGFFDKPVTRRTPAPFDRERAVAALPRFRAEQLQRMRNAMPRPAQTAEETARAVRERLMIEISFASSRLEGNTYDLIETQALLEYGQQAAGKSAEEARMILNHRDAIRYLLDHIDDVQIDKKTILDVHALVSNGLLAQRRDEGQVRERGVSITSSTYQPLDNRFQLEEVLEEMLEHVAHETDPFNQSLMLMVGIAYLQPFADCNKRTGRLMANLPLIKASLSPLSFITVDAANYTRGLLAYYELGFTEIISSAFVSGYIESAESYRLLAVPKGRSAEQKGFELKYRAFGTNYIKRLVRGEVSLDPELPGTVPAEDHAPLKQHLQQLVQDLHPGQAVVYGLQREEVERFLQRLSAAGGATGIQR